MRYVQIPKAVSIELAPATEAKPATLLEYTLAKMLDEFVWTSPRFRVDAEGVQERCGDLLASAPVGHWVELQDADHEILRNAIEAAPQWGPQFARKLNKIARSLTMAGSARPAGAKFFRLEEPANGVAHAPVEAELES